MSDLLKTFPSIKQKIITEYYRALDEEVKYGSYNPLSAATSVTIGFARGLGVNAEDTNAVIDLL